MAMTTKKNLTTEQVNNLIGDLLDKSSMVNGERRLAQGAVHDVSKNFEISRFQVYRIWKRALEAREIKGSYLLSPRKQGKVGRKALYDESKLEEQVEALSPRKRGTFRDIAMELGLPKTTAWRMIKGNNNITPHSSAIKPLLKEEDKVNKGSY